jgi:very-short-patch-repair endonuclease
MNNFEKNYDYTAYNKKLLDKARFLRKEMTPQEKQLWYQFLKTYPIKIYKQRPIGYFIADFYCSKAKLVIELDGSQHYTEDGKEYDEFRSNAISTLGVDIIRFSNIDIDENFEGVCFEIDKSICQRLGTEMKVFK